MVNNTSVQSLLQELQELVQAHRRAFKQERPFWRAMGMVLGEVFNFGRHTVTQGLLTLGMNEGDWSGLKKRNSVIVCWTRHCSR